MKSPAKRTMSKNNLINFLAELGQLKRVKRSGWWVAGISNPESVAEHSFRCSAIGYILARMEKADVNKVLLMTLFHDLHEARLNDLHKIGLRYIDAKHAEKKIQQEQLALLSNDIGDSLSAILEEYEKQISKESLIARDADILECILQAKEYLDSGFKQAKSFILPGKKHLKTKSAKRIFKDITAWNYKNWWFNLKEFKR